MTVQEIRNANTNISEDAQEMPQSRSTALPKQQKKER